MTLDEFCLMKGFSSILVIDLELIMVLYNHIIKFKVNKY